MHGSLLPLEPAGLELTAEEKAYAGLAHALMMSTWWIGPLVIFLTKRGSRFVRFHALQALLWQGIFTMLYVAGFSLFFVVLLASMPPGSQKPPDTQFPTALFVAMPLLWLISMVGFAVTMTLGILYCLKALRGEWAGYPVIGRWAARITGP